MSQAPLPDAPAFKSSTEDKGSLEVTASVDPDKVDHELDNISPLILPPATDEPVVTRRELWSYYRECCY